MTPCWMARRLSMEKSKDVKDVLAGYLKELHLPAFRSSYEELARQAQQEGLGFQQYLLGVGQRGGKLSRISEGCFAPQFQAARTDVSWCSRVCGSSFSSFA